MLSTNERMMTRRACNDSNFARCISTKKPQQSRPPIVYTQPHAVPLDRLGWRRGCASAAAIISLATCLPGASAVGLCLCPLESSAARTAALHSVLHRTHLSRPHVSPRRTLPRTHTVPRRDAPSDPFGLADLARASTIAQGCALDESGASGLLPRWRLHWVEPAVLTTSAKVGILEEVTCAAT